MIFSRDQRQIVRVRFFILLLGFFCSLAFQVSSLKAQQATLSISGRVTDLTSGVPLPSATVVAVATQGAQRFSRGATTDGSGLFEIQGLVPGRYRLVAKKSGYSQPTASSSNIFGDMLSLDSSVGNISLKLVRPGAISGTIKDPNGNPQPFATIQLFREQLSGTRIVRHKFTQVASNDLGEFRAYGLPPGAYVVSAYFRDDASVLGLRYRQNQDGQSYAEDYAPVYYPGTVDPQGSTPIELRDGADISNIDIQVSLVRTAEVTGSIECRGGMAGPVTVTLQPEMASSGPVQIFTVDCEKTDYVFRSVPQGTYIITAQARSNSENLMALEIVTVPTGIPTSVPILRLSALTNLKGSVMSSSESQLPERIVLRVESEDGKSGGDFPISPAGEFRVPPLSLGYHRLAIKQGAENLYVKSVVVGQSRMDPNRWILRNMSEGVKVELSQDGGGLNINLKRPEGIEYLNGSVVVVGQVEGNSSIYVRQAASDGTIKIHNLAPGEYRVAYVDTLRSEADMSGSIVGRVWQDGKKCRVENASSIDVLLEVSQ